MLPLAKDYQSSSAPHFDAVEDVKDWFGKGWDQGISRLLLCTSQKDLRSFIQTCDHLGVRDAVQVAGLYNLYRGGGRYESVVTHFHNGVLEAYVGVLEHDLEREWDRIALTPGREYDIANKAAWSHRQAVLTALGAPDRERLRVYLEWNGIIGYSDTVWAISRGEV